MGKYNSSKCVVQPFFIELKESGKVGQFLQVVLPKGFDFGKIEEIWFEGHPKEKVFPPRQEYLKWCRQNTKSLSCPEKAKECLRKNPRYKFEGGTHPDVYIRTSNCHVVIEAKWTEPNITAHTTWRKEGERDQLLRHMDALKDADNMVFGLFLIDASKKISEEVVRRRFECDWYYKLSLPHRVVDGTWQCVKNGYCGVFTWQFLKKELGVRNPECINI